VQEFDNLYDKEITKRYDEYKLKRLSWKRKEDRKKLVLEDHSNYI
jgi:hypothetical protein